MRRMSTTPLRMCKERFLMGFMGTEDLVSCKLTQSTSSCSSAESGCHRRHMTSIS